MATSVLITGGTGFLGSAIIDAARQSHPEWILTVMDINPPKERRAGVRYRTASILSEAEIHDVMKESKPVAVIHSAGIVPDLESRYGRQKQKQVFDVNVNGTRNILQAAKKHEVQAFVWTGSSTCVMDNLQNSYPNIAENWPTSTQSLIYGKSKAAAEALVIAASDQTLATCALRPSVIFGPGDYQLIPSIHACISKGETPFILGDGENMWDITYVTNVADAHILAIENLLSSRTAAGQAIFISNEQPIPFRDFCLETWKQFGHYPPFQIHIPKRLAVFIGYISELITWLTGSTMTLSRGSVLDACSIRYCNGVKARKILGYSPRVGIEEGIRITCEVSG